MPLLSIDFINLRQINRLKKIFVILLPWILGLFFLSFITGISKIFNDLNLIYNLYANSCFANWYLDNVFFWRDEFFFVILFKVFAYKIFVFFFTKTLTNFSGPVTLLL